MNDVSSSPPSVRPPRLSRLLLALLLPVGPGLCAEAPTPTESRSPTAAELLGNPAYPAMSYGGYREATREVVPTVEELKEDLRILAAMGIKLLRTYNTQQFAHAARLLEAIRALKTEDPSFEMYVMLGTWIECAGAWTPEANHRAGNVANNRAEIEAAVRMVQTYPDIVKIIAVGNEAMVQWAIKYFVFPEVILSWVEHLQALKASGEIPPETWITSSDNFESWGGGAAHYQTPELAALIEAVDFISLHTYPFHDTHNNPIFWAVPAEEEGLSDLAKVEAAMKRARDYAVAQYQRAADHVASLGLAKPIHIGETGWATVAGSSYGATGSQAADEYKAKLYYEAMREWTTQAGLSCFYFEAFDERWKDPFSAAGSENHFGLITLQGEAKYALWDLVDAGVFDGLERDGRPITKTYGGDEAAVRADLLIPPPLREMGILQTTTVNATRSLGEPVAEKFYVLLHEWWKPAISDRLTYPSAPLKPNAWEGTCTMKVSREGVITVTTGTGEWWGCALELQGGGRGENLTRFADGALHFEIRGTTEARFEVGFQTGMFAHGTQTNNFVTFGTGSPVALSPEWKIQTIPLPPLNNDADLTDVTIPLYLRGIDHFDGGQIELRNVFYSRP